MDKNGFIKYLENKDYAQKTISHSVRCVDLFFRQISKEDIQITAPDVLKYLEYLKNVKKLQNVSCATHLTALKHYFSFLYHTGQIDRNPCLLLKIRGTKRKILHKIYTPDELDEFFDNYYQLFVRNYDHSRIKSDRGRKLSALGRERNAAILSILVHQGIITTEAGRIEIQDLDLIKATLKIRGTKNHNERTIPLKATQIGLLMHYLHHIRPQLLEYQAAETDKLFLALPAIDKKKKENDITDKVFVQLSNQIKTIDKQFINLQQVRASVITFWVKTQGLRKAQYLAGHRFVSSTEKYVYNDLDDLTDDINKLHPFL